MALSYAPLTKQYAHREERRARGEKARKRAKATFLRESKFPGTEAKIKSEIEGIKTLRKRLGVP